MNKDMRICWCGLAVLALTGLDARADNLMGAVAFLNNLNGLEVVSVLADSDGSMVVGGIAKKAGLPVSAKPLQPGYVDTFCGVAPGPGSSPNPCGDAHVARFALDGRPVFATYLGGAGADVLSAVGLDSSGGIYVLGISGSSDFPIPLTSQGRMGTTRTGAFLIRILRDGTIGFARTLPITQDATPVALAISDNSVYVTGTAFPGSLATTDGALQPQPAAPGQADAFVIKVDAASGDVLYAT